MGRRILRRNQMEGAAFEDGKGLCVADINEYQKDIPLEKRNNAEITTAVIQNAVQAEGRNFPKRRGIDFYHTYKEDLKLLGKDGLGLTSFRTSINWARIFRRATMLNQMKKGWNSMTA